ncbi:Protocadherin Fat 1 [Acropora cervicornis]|uniref:Protocadherin Fat 1 n=1 Tax=Acropora cervicornis TaxID=6130 RepID=A0AAD9QVZ8_ACRCE|nr:Protocadherin Fat 1 [Acropora cervicornis]
MTRYLVILLTLAVKATVIEGGCKSIAELVSVNETAPPGTYIISADCLALSSYSLRGEDVEWFQINSTAGVITTNRSLDAEVIGTPPFLQVDVVPSGCQGQSCSPSLTLFVHVYDINDNVPQFMHLPYNVNVSEPGGDYPSTIHLRAAEEKQNGFPFRSEKEILSMNEEAVPKNTKMATKFGLAVFNAWFQKQEELNSTIEEMTPQQLKKNLQKSYLSARRVLAPDEFRDVRRYLDPLLISTSAVGLKRSCSAPNVTPMRLPKRTTLTFTVATTKVKTVVFSVSAIDVDTGVGPNAQGNKEVIFDIVGGDSNGTFSIGGLSNAGDIILEKPLDFESSNKIFHLNVTATSSRWQTRDVIGYEDVCGDRLIEWMGCKDRYGTGLQNWTIVTITVTNADDNELTFLQSVYEVLVTANPLKKGLEVAKVEAEDKDLNPFSYEFFPASNPDDKFMMNNLTGSISVNKNLTRGTYYLIAMKLLLFMIRVEWMKGICHLWSRGRLISPSLPVGDDWYLNLSSQKRPTGRNLGGNRLVRRSGATSRVHVGSKPNQTFTASVVENAANISVLNLQVVEKYFNVSNAVFTILSGSDRNKFVIDQTAKELRVGAQGLDREENTRATVVVEVQSSGINRGFAMIVVEILDVNDNSPQFQSSTSVAVREDVLVGSQIYTVVATDIDVAGNGKMVYEIVGGNEEGK